MSGTAFAPEGERAALAAPRDRSGRLTARARSAILSLPATALVAGNGIYAASQLALVITVAKLGNVLDVGEFAYAFAATTPIFVLSHLQLRALQATDAAGEFSFREYLSLRLATTTVAALVVVGIWAATGADGAHRNVLLAMVAAKIVESLADVTHGRLLQIDRARVVGASFASRGLFGSLAFAIVFAATSDLVRAILAMAAWWVVSFLLIERRELRLDAREHTADGAGPVALARIVKLALFAAPMGIVVALTSLNTQVPRYFIDGALGTSGLGVFAGLAALPLGGTTIVNPLCQAAAARLAQAYLAGDGADFRRTVAHLLYVCLGIGAAMSAIVVILGDRLVTTIYSSEYAGQRSTLLLLMVWGTLAYVTIVLGSAVTAARRLAAQLPVLAAGTAVTAVACMALVPGFGLGGAAVGASAGMLVEAVCFALLLRRLVRTQP